MSGGETRQDCEVTAERESLATLVEGAWVGLVGRFSGRGLLLVAQVIIARALDLTTFGLFTTGWTVLRLGADIAPLGLNNGVIHFGARAWPQRAAEAGGLARLSSLLSFASGAVVGAMLFFGSEAIATGVFSEPALVPVLKGFGIALPFACGLKTIAAATRVTQKMLSSVIAEDFGQPLVFLILVAVVLVSGLGLQAMVMAAACSFVAAMFIGWWRLERDLPERASSGIPLATLMAFSIPTAATSALSGSIVWVDRLFIAVLDSAESVGLYLPASWFAIVFTLILMAFNSIFAPMIAELAERGNWERLQRLYHVATRWGVILGLPLAALLLARPAAVLEGVFGAAYVPGATCLVILTSAQLVNLATGAAGYLLIMTGHQNRWLLLSGGAFVANVVLNVVLIENYGYLGAAIATGLSIACLFGVSIFEVKRLIGLWPWNRAFIKVLVAGAAAIASLVFAAGFGLSPGLLSVSLELGLAIVVTAAVIALLGFDDSDRELGELLLQRISKR